MLGNCVGFGNYKFFLCLLGFGLAQAVFVLLQNAPFVLELMAERSGDEETSAVVAGVAALIAFACTLAALVLLLTHAQLVAQNRTTIENSTLFRLRRALRRARRARNGGRGDEDDSSDAASDAAGDAASEYARARDESLAHNLGRARNFREVFGDDPWRWLLPVFTSKGDGCAFPHNAWSASSSSERVELLTGA